MKHVFRFLGWMVFSIVFLVVMVSVYLYVHPAYWGYRSEFFSAEPAGEVVGTMRGVILTPSLPPTSWKGMVFSSDAEGTNRVGETERYQFQTTARDGRLLLIYDSTENPWFARRVVEEIVRREDGTHLGRFSIRIVGTKQLPIGWFALAHE